MCTVANGAFQGYTITDLGNLDHNGFWRRDCSPNTFPVLVKLIDVKDDLSIQVYPSDKTAVRELGEQGKAEMWYIVDCDPKSYIYFGFSHKISKVEFKRRAKDGSICDVLNKVPVVKGDVFYILPGTIHAICAGIVIAEIQQSSDTTFRVFDYHRQDATGQQRTLHLEQAERGLNYEPTVPEECKTVNSGVFKNFTVTEMFSCEYFCAFRIDVHNCVNFHCDGTTFQHLLCVEGGGNKIHQGYSYSFQQGDYYFLPAQMGEYQIQGQCKMLLTKI